MAGRSRLTTEPDEAVRVLRAGGLVGLPTETVYGLAADATNPEAISRVFSVKGRPIDHPLIVHVAGPGDLDEWAREVPDVARRLVDRWWPGPLTVLLRRAPGVLDAVTGGRDTVALRAPAHPMAQTVLVGFGGGVVAPSANRFGRVSPTSAADVSTELGDTVDLVLDGGPCQVGVESTIVDLTGSRPVILRRGQITEDDLAEVAGPVEVVSGAAEVIAPGMLAAHYSPEARLLLCRPGTTDPEVVALVRRQLLESPSVGVLAPTRVDGLPVGAVELDPAGDGDHYARVLYARLRDADARGLERLVVVPPPAQGIGAAVLDRLTRAAHR